MRAAGGYVERLPSGKVRFKPPPVINDLGSGGHNTFAGRYVQIGGFGSGLEDRLDGFKAWIFFRAAPTSSAQALI